MKPGKEHFMKSSLDYLNGRLCILNESELGASSPGGALKSIREWYAVRETAEAEVATLVGRPVSRVESEDDLYVDEDGNPYQLAPMGKDKPFAIKITPLRRTSNRSGSCSPQAESDTQPSAPGPAVADSVGRSSAGSSEIRPKELMRKPRRKRQTAAREDSNRLLGGGVAMLAELPKQSAGDETREEKDPRDVPELSPTTPLNLRQK